MPSIDGIRRRIDRADEHLKALKIEVGRLVKQLNLNGVVRQREDGTADYIWVVDAAPERTHHISLIAGDVVHNLRSSLDHIVWELTTENARGKRPLPEFPIFANPGPGGAGFHEAGVPKIWSLPIEAKAVIERLQPFQGRNKELLDLQTLDNIDKHRRLLTAPFTIVGIGIGAPKSGVAYVGELTISGTGRKQHGDIIARRPATEPETEVRKLNMEFPFQISLEEKGVSGPIVDRLDGLHEFVRDTVLPQFEPFFS